MVLGRMKIGQRRKLLWLQALDARSIKYERIEGEAAFYGPKIDFKIEDAIGRSVAVGHGSV